MGSTFADVPIISSIMRLISIVKSSFWLLPDIGRIDGGCATKNSASESPGVISWNHILLPPVRPLYAAIRSVHSLIVSAVLLTVTATLSVIVSRPATFLVFESSSADASIDSGSTVISAISLIVVSN